MRRRVRRFLRCTKSNIIKFATPFCIFYLRSFCPTKHQKKKENRKGKLEKFRSGFVPLRSLGCCQGFPSYASLLQQLNYSTEICSSLQKSRALDGRKKPKESERAPPKKNVEWRLGKTKFVLGLVVVIVANAAAVAAAALLWCLLYYAQVLFSK